MKSKILLFVSFISFLFSFSANASVNIVGFFSGTPGQDSLRVYVNYSACNDTDRVGWVKYGLNFANFTPNQKFQLGNGQMSFLLTGLAAGTEIPVRICHWRPGENVACTANDTFATADPPFITTIDLISGSMTDSGLVIYFGLNTTAPAILQPFWDASDSIGVNPQYGNVVNYAATSGTEMKYFLVQNYFLPDTYSVAIRFQNDSLMQIGQWGYSDPLPPMILSGIVEAGPLAGVFIPSVVNDLLVIDLPHLRGEFALFGMQGNYLRQVRFANRVEVDVSQYPPGIYICRLITEEGYQKSHKLLIAR